MGRSVIIRMPCIHPYKLKQHLLNKELSHFNCLHWDTMRGKGEKSNPANTGQIMRNQGLKNDYILRDASAYHFLIEDSIWQFRLNGVLTVCKSFCLCHSGRLLGEKINFYLPKCHLVTSILGWFALIWTMWFSWYAIVIKTHTALMRDLGRISGIMLLNRGQIIFQTFSL